MKILNVYRDSILAIDDSESVNKCNHLLKLLTCLTMELNKLPDRGVLYPRDIENIFGCCRRHARRIARNIREKLGKLYMGWVTIKEFCDHFQMQEEEVIKYLRN